MTLKQIIYASQPFGYDGALLSSILIDARRCNKRDGITGALVCRHDIYLQLLEGPADKVDAAYGRIMRDDRHVNPIQLVSRDASERMFGGWDMLHDPAKTWLWTEQEIADDVPSRTPAAEILALFETLRQKAQADLQT